MITVSENAQQLAQEILDWTIANPKRFDMGVWVGVGGVPARPDDELCDTTLCLAGTAVFLRLGEEGLRDCLNRSLPFFDDMAGQWLGLNDEEVNILFYTDEDVALQGITALANGDADKFNEVIGV